MFALTTTVSLNERSPPFTTTLFDMLATSTKYTVVSLIIAGAFVGFVSLFLAPHILRVLNDEHQQYITSRSASRPAVKLRPITTTDLRNVVRSSRKDTILVHLWNSWSADGTKYFGSIEHFKRNHQETTAVIHICTDMSGIRQLKASAMIAERNGVRGMSYVIRSKASLFDLHNESATSRFVNEFAGEKANGGSPSILLMNRHGQILTNNLL